MRMWLILVLVVLCSTEIHPGGHSFRQARHFSCLAASQFLCQLSVYFSTSSRLILPVRLLSITTFAGYVLCMFAVLALVCREEERARRRDMRVKLKTKIKLDPLLKNQAGKYARSLVCPVGLGVSVWLRFVFA